jgi:hypothetical protein
MVLGMFLQFHIFMKTVVSSDGIVDREKLTPSHKIKILAPKLFEKWEWAQTFGDKGWAKSIPYANLGNGRKIVGSVTTWCLYEE